MSRAVVIETGSGVIVRVLVGDPTMLALQVGVGQSLWVMGGEDDGALIDDRWVIVGPSGDLEVVPGAPVGVGAPSAEIYFAMSR